MRHTAAHSLVFPGLALTLRRDAPPGPVCALARDPVTGRVVGVLARVGRWRVGVWT